MGCCARTARVRNTEPDRSRRDVPNAAAAHRSPLLELQQTAGNRATSALIQTKLMVGAAHDEHEQHADRVAAQVASGGPAAPTAGAVRAAEATPAPPEVESGIRAARGGGRQLPGSLREHMETSLGSDFRDVRIHTGASASSLNQQLQARAFTTGRDIFLRNGHDDLASGAGRELIAHELTHVVQQGAAAGNQTIRRKCLECNKSKGHAPTCSKYKAPTPKPKPNKTSKMSWDEAQKKKSGQGKWKHHKRPEYADDNRAAWNARMNTN